MEGVQKKMGLKSIDEVGEEYTTCSATLPVQTLTMS
jgi:hypothetical protein